MKRLSASLFAIALALIAASVPAAPARADGTTTTALVPVTDLYTPRGFDTNDDTQVVVSGYLPNLCYKAPRVDATVVGKTIILTVQAIVNTWSQACPRVIVPFLEPVSLGVLGAGTYRVIANAGSNLEQSASIGVREATNSSVDDHVYANVEYVEKIDGSRKIRLRGYNPSDCFQLDRVEFASNGKDVYAVLPIMKPIFFDCPMKMVPFTIEADVPTELSAEEILLHVRVLHGKSINTLFPNL